MDDKKSKRKNVKGNAQKEDKKKKKSTDGENMEEEPVTQKVKNKVPGRKKNLGPSGQDWDL